MGALRRHTRFDVAQLARQGSLFLQLLQQNQGLAEQKTLFRAWLAQVERLLDDDVDATDRMYLEEGVIAFRELFSGKPIILQAVPSMLGGMVGALNKIRRSHTFTPVKVADDTFARFLRATKVEDDQLALGEAISAASVAKTAKLDIDVVRRCVARLVDEDLGYEPPDEEDDFQIDHERLQFTLMELNSVIRSHSAFGTVPSHVANADAASEISSLVARWREIRDELTKTAQMGSNITIHGDQIVPILGELETEGLRLVCLFAPWLQEKWNNASRKPQGVWDDIERRLGKIEVSGVVREMRDRLPILEAVEREVRRNVPRVVATHPSISEIPPVYSHLEGDLKRFHDDDPFDRNVFVMMKFPDAAGTERWQLDILENIYSAVKDELERHGLVARRADKKTYAASKQLWDNLCIYMLGCRYGVAVLEDHVGDEFNPNVALEYGFMKGLGREVLLLKEQRFKHLRADLIGTIPKEFEIQPGHIVDKRSIHDAISNWLTDIGVAPKRAR